jgi:hypothetical protein
MKSSSIILSVIVAFLSIAGCRKSDNPKVPDLARVPLPLFTLDSTSETKIPGTNSASFKGSFNVDVYFKQGDMPKKFDIVVIKNGDKSTVKTIQADVSTFPTHIDVTGQQLIDLFGAPIALGDVFTVGADVTTADGLKYAAFPLGGTTFAPGIGNQPGTNSQLSFAAPCLFVAADYVGDYTVVRDDWADYVEGEDIAVNVIDDTHLSFKYKADGALPIIMVVDPLTNSVTIAKQVYGSYGGDVYSAESIPGDASSVDPCTVSISVNIHHSTAGGTFDGVIIMTKK